MGKLRIYCDGGSRGNPGLGASAFVVFDENGEVLAKQGIFLGHTTNNQAEYNAVLHAFLFLHQLGGDQKVISGVSFFLDSELVVKQLTGAFRIKDKKLQLLALRIKQLERQLSIPVVYTAVPRAQNKFADKLVNQVLDSRHNVTV